MADQIKTITDKSQFPMIMEKFFSKGNVFLKRKSGDLNIQYLGMSGNDIAFRIPRVKSCPEKVIAFVRIKDSTINCNLIFVESNEDTFIFTPQLFQILSIRRKEGRSEIDDGANSKTAIFIENIISDFVIKNELSMNPKKIDEVREIVKFDLKKQFENIIIFFINQSGSDHRMKHFQQEITPIYIQDLNSEPEGKDKDKNAFNEYINNIYSNDYKLSNRKEFISEVSIPVLLHNIIPYGYLQVNNTKPISDGQLTVIKRMVIIINEFFKKKKMFQSANEKFLVSDLSKGGLGIVFKDRRLIRHIKVDSLVCFELMLPTMKKVIVGATVKNLSFLEVHKLIKVGFEIQSMDAISEVNYDEFLEMIKKK